MKIDVTVHNDFEIMVDVIAPNQMAAEGKNDMKGIKQRKKSNNTLKHSSNKLA